MHTNCFSINFESESAAVTLKIRSRSAKSNYSFPCMNDLSVLIWSNSSHQLNRQCAHKLLSIKIEFQRASATLKI